MKILSISRGFDKRDGIARCVVELAERFVEEHGFRVVNKRVFLVGICSKSF